MIWPEAKSLLFLSHILSSQPIPSRFLLSFLTTMLSSLVFDGCLKRPAHDSALRVAHFVHFTGTINSILLFA